MLLLVEGVELNSGSTVMELARNLRNLLHPTNPCVTRFKLLYQLFQINWIKYLPNYQQKINSTNKQQNMRIIAPEQTLTINYVEHSDIINSAIGKQGNNNVQNKSEATNETIERVNKNVIDKNKRKNNAIIFNLPDTNSFIEDKRRLSSLFSDFNLDEKMID